MPWMECSTMSLRFEFVSLAQSDDANITKLCQRFGISSKTGYKWMKRFSAEGASGLSDRSRRPRCSPGKTEDELEQRICQMRQAHTAWGGRKIRARLLALKHRSVPAASTITDILRRNDLLSADESPKHKTFTRFEHEHPNDLWQMDFLGHFPTDEGRCHSLTVLDDCSRFCIGLKACGDEKSSTVQGHLTTLFRRYGLPRRILSDNGSPWGCDSDYRYTHLSVWLIRLGVGVSHGRPYHPQTQGKDERFHRTLRAEAIGARRFCDLHDVQRRFDPWRDIYNLERPHEALNLSTPATRYQPSPRVFPEVLPAIEYDQQDDVRKVNDDGYFNYKSTRYKISQAFTGHRIALRLTQQDGMLDVFFCQQKIATIDLKRQSRR